MKKFSTIILSLAIMLVTNIAYAQHNAGNNGKILMIASNPSINQKTGWTIGVWYS